MIQNLSITASAGFMVFRRWIAIGSVSILLLPNLAAAAKNPWYGVALSDVDSSRELNGWLRTNVSDVLGDKIKTLYDTVHGVNSLEAISFVQFLDGEFAFLYLIANAESTSLQLVPNQIPRPLEFSQFKIDIDIYHRQILIQDQMSDSPIKFIFPIAHGGLNVTESRVTTPLFKNAFIDKATIISQRHKPSYFRGKPFIRVMTSKTIKDGWTGIGLHILQNPELRRRPDSHGCLRLRAWDLKSLHALLKNHPDRHTPLDIHMITDLEANEVALHPFKIDNQRYKKEKNFAETGTSPRTVRGKQGLIIYETIPQSPMPHLNEMVSI